MLGLVVPQLQRVLDRPEQDIGQRQPPILARQDALEVRQSDQSFERVRAPHRALRTTVLELQELRHELDVADRALPRFHIAEEPSFLLKSSFDLVLHRADVVAVGLDGDVEQDRFDAFQEVGAERQLPGDRTRFQQCLLLPQRGVGLQVFDVGFDRANQCSGLAPRTQSHINSVQETFARCVHQRADQPLPQFPILPGVRLADEDEINVRAVVEFLSAELAESQDAELVRRDGKFIRQQRQRRLRDAVREQRQLQRHRLEVEQPEAVACSNPQQLPMLIPPQCVELRGQRRSNIHGQQRCLAEVFAALKFRQTLVGRQLA